MNWEEKIISFFENELDAQEILDLQEAVRMNEDLSKMMDEYTQLYESFDNAPQVEPSAKLQSRFDDVLANAVKEKSSKAMVFNLNGFTKVAAAAVLIMVGVFVGKEYSSRQDLNDLNDQMADMRYDMKSLINDESSTARIQAVSLAHNTQDPDSDMINILIETMADDKSSNVRLAAVKSLEKHMQKDFVRVELITALNNEKDPAVLIEIIQQLSRFKDKEALEPLDKLTKDVELYKFVRDEAHLGIIQITST